MSHMALLTFPWMIAVGHLASWDIHLPHAHGRFWWRVLSLTLIAAPVAMLRGRYFRVSGNGLHPLPSSDENEGHDQDEQDDQREFLAICVYFTARIGLLVLICYSFLELPDGAYTVAGNRWLQFLPFVH